jgi:putative addiction module component (TIGR02574 family)
VPQIATVGLVGGFLREDGAIGAPEEPAGFGSSLFSMELAMGQAELAGDKVEDGDEVFAGTITGAGGTHCPTLRILPAVICYLVFVALRGSIVAALEREEAQTGGCEMTASGYSSAMILEKFPEVQQLSASEKLIFVSELWNDLEAHPSEVPVSREIIAELDRRMEHFRQHPDEFTTWEAVKGRILGSRP